MPRMDGIQFLTPEMVRDSVGELVNIITGNLQSNISGAGILCKLEAPNERCQDEPEIQPMKYAKNESSFLHRKRSSSGFIFPSSWNSPLIRRITVITELSVNRSPDVRDTPFALPSPTRKARSCPGSGSGTHILQQGRVIQQMLLLAKNKWQLSTSPPV